MRLTASLAPSPLSDEAARPFLERRIPRFAQIALMAVAYFMVGQIGLLLDIPPGYATVIWPPSGIAVGALVVFGRALWPGIFLGALLLNATAGQAYSAEAGWAFGKFAVPVVTAAGSTVQALLVRQLIVRFNGKP